MDIGFMPLCVSLSWWFNLVRNKAQLKQKYSQKKNQNVNVLMIDLQRQEAAEKRAQKAAEEKQRRK